MAAFSHFLLDTSSFLSSASNSIPIHDAFSNNETLSTDTNQSSNMTLHDSHHEPSLTPTPSPADTSVSQNKQKKNKKRANNASCSSKEERTEGRNKKQKNFNGVVKHEEKPKIVPPGGYIHVRARRGEATDSHSLAERVRREKISEKMRMLQALVPGCDKITGKALVLDQIINYVQSLQNQVESLSMKLSSVNPMFGDALMATPDRLNSVDLALPSVPQCSRNQATIFSHDYNLLDDLANTVFLQVEGSNVFSSQLDVVSDLWDVQDQPQNFSNPCDGFSTNLWSFQS